MKTFKYFIFLILLSILGASAVFVACTTHKYVFNISYQCDENGYIDGLIFQTVTQGECSEEVKAVPNEGYKFVEWSDGITTDTRTETNVNSDITVTAIFAKLSYSVIYEIVGNGTIEGEANQTVKYGESAITVTAIPNDGYKFVKWSDGIATATRTETNVNSDITVTAIFEKTSYSVIYVTDGNGTIDGETNQIVEYGESAITVTAIPNEGYKFVKWSDELTVPERQDNNVIKDITVKAIFDKLTYSLSYEVGNGGYLIGNANQTVAYGESGTKVTAIPNDGYKFVKWSDGETNETRYEIEVKSALIVTAEFEFLFAGGDGTQFNPFKIETYTQLLDIRLFPDKYYQLICDLDLNGINHEPIFDANEYFSGGFYGGNKTIKNLTVQTDSNFPSLFGMIFDGIVADLNLENVSITTTDFNTIDDGVKYYVGTIAGYVVGLIDNVNVSGNITVNGLSYDGVAIGGLAGMAIGTISDCNVNVHINVKNVFSIYTNYMNYPFIFGGILGVADSAYIRNCSVQGEINVTECFWFEEGGVITYNRHTDILIGGMVGYYFTSGQVKAYIRDSETDITIYGDNHYNTGGFIGRLDVNEGTELNITNNSVHGDIKVGVVGGFIFNGYTYGGLLIENCYTESEITGYSYAAGFIKNYTGTDNNCIFRNCYSLSNIKTHYVFDSERIVGNCWGFGYQLSNMEFINCYSSGNVYSQHGGGFIGYITNSKLECCYSSSDITLLQNSGSGIFIYSLNSTEVENCYSTSNIIYDSQTDQSSVMLIKSMSNGSKISNFYYSGNCIGAVVDIISDSLISNCHILRASDQAVDLIGRDRGTVPSFVDITTYETSEEMYLLADTLNEGQEEKVWVNQENDLPILKSIN